MTAALIRSTLTSLGCAVALGASVLVPSAVDPANGTVTALRPGTATVSVTVNGVTATQEITVTE